MLTINSCLNPYISEDGMSYACGYCLPCKKNKMLEWSIRARHELMYHDKCMFITLTYNYKNLRVNKETIPYNKHDKCGTLHQEDVQLFLKRLRQQIKPKKIKYIYSAEYGDLHWRPHYHMIIYGINETIVSQEKLRKIWGKGFVDVSPLDVTDNAIQYVLGYVRKKLPNKEIKDFLFSRNHRIAPYMRASKGIGKQYVQRHMKYLSKTMKTAYRNGQYAIPRYYVKQIKKYEGRTIKYKVNYFDKDTKEMKTRTEYKVLPNIYAPMTRDIIKHETNYIKKLKEYKKKYNINKKLENAIIKYYKDRKKRYFDEYLKYYNKTDKELSKIFSKTIPLKEPREKLSNKSLIERTDKKLYKKMKSSAKQKAKNIKKGKFGKRDKYEILEELNQTNVI